MTAAEKRGALLFFGKAQCVQCHAVAARSAVGESNEMFTDFVERVIGVPQIAPFFGAGQGDVIFDGLGQDGDFGLETGDAMIRPPVTHFDEAIDPIETILVEIKR